MLLLLLLIGGGSSAWGEEITFTAPEGWTTAGEKQSFTKDGVTISTTQGAGAESDKVYSYRIYKGQTFTVASTVGEITKIEITCTANNTVKYGPGSFETIEGYSYSGKIGTWTGSATSVRLKASSNQVRATKIVVTVESTPAANLTSIEVSGTPTNKTYFDGEAFDPTGLVVTGTYDDGTQKEITDGIVWAKDPEILKLGTTSVDVIASVGNIVSGVYTVEGITVKEKATLIAIEAKGSPAEFWKGDKFNHDGITITARWSDKSETDVTSDCKFTEPDMNTAGKKTVTVTYENKTCTYDIEVKTIENTKETAYTVSKAIALIDAGKDLASQVYVKGIVSKIVTPFTSKYGDVSFNVSVDGSINGQQFRFFRTQKDAENIYTEDPNIEVGATVTGCGTLDKYNDIYEFKAGNYLVDYKAPVEKVLKSIAISGEATKTTYTEGEAFDPAGLVVTATYEDESTEVVTGRVKWTFNPETLVLGTTSVEVMASIGSDAISEVYIVNGITVNEKVVLVGNSIIVAEDKKNSKWVAMSTSNIIDTKSDYFESVDLVKVGDKYITTGKLDDILFYVNTVDGKTTIQNPADDKYVQATAAKKVSYTENVYLWSNDGKNLTAATADLGFLKYNASASRFNVYTGTNAIYFATIVDKSNVYEGAEIALSGTDGTHYFTTFSSDKAVEFVDATVYTVGVNDNKLSLNEVKGNQVPANTGVLVQSNETNAMYVYIESAPAIEGNLLRASVTEQTTTGADDTKEYKYYMLSYNKDNENLGFYWGENDGAAFTSKAGRAYLAVEKTNEVAAVKGFSLSDMETGISQVCGSAANDGVIYDLQGRRVERAVRGLYIMNGRKVMVK